MANYSAIGHHSPIGDEHAGFIQSYPKKKGTSNWIKFGIPVAILVIAGAVVGGILGSRASKKSSTSGGGGGGGGAAAASSAASIKASVGVFATATNSLFMVPLYPTATSAAYTTPQFNPTTDSTLGWPQDSFQPKNPSPTSPRPDRPRLFAPAYKWAALPQLISTDPYLKKWNDTIFGNATVYYSLDPVQYFLDNSSGILDNARYIKERVKAFSYVYRMTNDTKWVDRTYRELQNAVSNGTQPFGTPPDLWNSGHFLDTAEMSAAFAIAYDWLYDQWSPVQLTAIRDAIIQYGLNYGIQQYTTSAGWWTAQDITGNWNCVSNGGMTIAALALLGDDTTGTAEKILGYSIPNAKQACVNGPTPDGTWSETANYWYFGTTGHAEMSAALKSATGSDYDMLTTNANFSLTGDYHMYAYGPTSLFDWGDHGPNKYSSTANTMQYYASAFNMPVYSLHQRDRADAAEPWSMFWYDPTVSGAFWNGLPLDRFFDNAVDQWVSMRSSWTDFNALFVGMKAGTLQGHQTHNDLDVGDFVLDALGTRWAGELGSGDYNSPGYFSNDNQTSQRWLYYRKMTEGQNTILISQQNQIVTAAPTILNSGSSGTAQGSSPVLTLGKDDTAFWVADLTSAYGNVTSVKRGVRLLNGRKQVLIQDEINSQGDIQWRMHTNATVTIDSPTGATLVRDGQTLKVSILSPSSGFNLSTTPAQRFPTDPPPPIPDQPNPNITVFIISMPPGTYNLQVLFNPQWNDGTQLVTPPSVDLDSWSLTSHN